jgi:hypothetical protein
MDQQMAQINFLVIVVHSPTVSSLMYSLSLFCFSHEHALLHDSEASCKYVTVHITLLFSSVYSSNTANAHRLFVVKDTPVAPSPTSTPSSSGNLSGIVSIVDSTYSSYN